jgi:hypothetical protein
MCYATGVAYKSGNPTRIFRPIATNGDVCGYPGTTAEPFPYAYYANPMDMVNNRYCVASCPAGADTSLATSSGAVAVTVNINSAGTASPTTWTTTAKLAYDSSLILERICIPSTAAFTNALANYASSFASVREGELGNFIMDIKNVLLHLFRTGDGSSWPSSSQSSSPSSSCSA